MRRKLLGLILICGFIFNSTIVYAEENTDKITIVDYEQYYFDETAFYNLIPLEEPEDDEQYSLMQDVLVSSRCTDEKNVIISVENIGDVAIENWTITYEANYKVLGSLNANVISDEYVIELSADCTNYIIMPSETVNINISIDGQYEDLEQCRVYALSYTNDNNEVLDTITYTPETQSTELEITDISDCSEQMQHDDSIEAMYDINFDVSDSRIGIDKIIGQDGRSKVTAVNSNPYNSIACLIITWSDGTKSQGTGYMISSNYMLTAAHCLYNRNLRTSAKSITAYFGADGTKYAAKYEASLWSYCSDYPSNPSVANDWGAIKFNSNPGRGKFAIGYTNDNSLKNTSLTVCGYPGDKAQNNKGALINGKNRYMYKMTSKPSAIETNAIHYTIDTYEGQSGSPVYNSGNVSYGIHTRGTQTENSGRRFTATLLKAFKQKGWY